MLFSKLCKITVNKVTFEGFRGGRSPHQGFKHFRFNVVPACNSLSDVTARKTSVAVMTFSVLNSAHVCVAGLWSWNQKVLNGGAGAPEPEI